MVTEESDDLRQQVHQCRQTEFLFLIIYHQVTCKRSALEPNRIRMSSRWGQACCAVPDARCGVYCRPLAAACSSLHLPTCAAIGARPWKSLCAMPACPMKFWKCMMANRPSVCTL